MTPQIIMRAERLGAGGPWMWSCCWNWCARKESINRAWREKTLLPGAGGIEGGRSQVGRIGSLKSLRKPDAGGEKGLGMA